MIDRLQQVFPNFGFLQESSLRPGVVDNFWQVTAFNKEGVPLGSGYSKDLNTARKIAIAEFIERSYVLEQLKSNENNSWLLDQFPTACGFAAGFNSRNTQIRSIGEALERWALSQWVDKGCALEENNSLVWSNGSLSLLNDFDQVFTYKKSFLYTLNDQIIPYQLSVVVGMQGDGAFMGSGVRSTNEEANVHALVEAHRHLLISRQNRNFNIFPYSRIRHFANNRKSALSILKSKKEASWLKPQIRFQRTIQNDFFSISRTIFEDWIPWERGAIDRMLY